MTKAVQIPLMEEVGDPQTRREGDFYETRRWQMAVLLTRVHLDPSWTYVEPAAGNGAIVKMLQAQRLQKVWTNDVVQREMPLLSTADATDPATWRRMRDAMGHIDVTLTNMPFVLAFPMIQLAVEYSRRAVIALLRRTWDEPTIERNEWLAAHPCTAQIVPPRADYRGTGSGESATHAWFIWAKDRSIIRKPHDVVPIREAETFAAQYGEKL